MAWYRTRRKLGVAWRNHRWVDLCALFPAGLAVFLPASCEIAELQRSFLAASASLIAVLVAVVTFACAFIYQAQHPSVESFRKKHRASLKAAWLWCVSGILIAALATLAAIIVAHWSISGAWVVAVGALCFSLALTVRSLDFLRWAMGVQ